MSNSIEIREFLTSRRARITLNLLASWTQPSEHIDIARNPTRSRED